MPRECSLCNDSQNRDRIERALANGASFASVSRETRFSLYFPDSIERHWNNHVASELRGNQGARLGLGAVTIASRMVELMSAASEIRVRAMATGHDSTAIRAIVAEQSLLASIADRVGIPADQALNELPKLAALAAAVQRAVRANPAVGEALATELDAADRSEDAADLRILFSETTRKAVSA
ncbi:hypothetical protein IFU08_09780 [Microbacterium sp. CFBP 8790]|uniref:hypothetical protein n=1 Tax=unclassified Microbacterium TaxID=2609290 RepID=UPI001781BF21|nr:MULTISPECIES: hypothetical protein [unclassified Microbacterium]MBD8205091.1 hypothetical protein [Microbacterium sp. CFBP 8801]MBD8509854.1 hypothetical protein [Microbacterium sp. CFBP 8790]